MTPKISTPKKRMTQASFLVAMLLGAGSAHANNPQFIYQMGVDGKSTVPDWLVINNIYGSWFNVGGNYSCGIWTPPESTISWGDSFQQSRVCLQNQDRDVTPILLNPILNTTKSGDVYQESRVINVTQYNTSIGELDYITGERPNNWGFWVDDGGNYNCDTWTPDTDTVNLFQNFTQTRDCSQNQNRTRQVFNVWASGLETPKRIDTESQTISEQQSRVVQGSRDFIDGQSIKPWSAWLDEGAFYACDTWSPNSGTINLDQNFTQNRTCSQDQVSDRDVYDVWASGRETFLRTENRQQTIPDPQSQASVGTKDFITTTRNGDYTSWANSSAPRNCTEWTPNVSTINLDDGFTQTRSCKQDQSRTRIVYDVWQSGVETENRTETDTQVIDVDQSQASVGTKDYIIGDEALAWGAWSNTGGPYACGAWGASPSTQLNDYNQTRSCSQNQSRTRTINNVWQSGARTFKETETGAGTISVTQTRGVNVSHSAWVDSGVQYACAAWTPQAANQTSSFTQSEVCKQNQVRNRIYTSGSENLSQVQETRTVDETNTRSVAVTAAAWTDTTRSAYSSWSPVPSTQPSDFVQSRIYTQNQVRTWNYVTGGASIHTRQETGAVANRSESRPVTVTYSAWRTNGGIYECGVWLPAVSTQTSDFSQSQACKQNEERDRVYATGGTELNRALEARTVDATNNRTVDVVAGAWSDTTRNTYSAWSPAPSTQTATFPQNRTYTQNRVRTWTYTASSASIGTRQETGALSSQNESRSVTVGYSAWTNTGTRTCGEWGPATDTVNLNEAFTQTRDCSQPQQRDRNYTASGSVISTATEARNIPVTESRASTGARDFITGTAAKPWTAWSNEGGEYSCGAWGPTPSAQTTTFNQTRTCKQNQERTRNIVNVWESGRETQNRVETGTQVIDTTQTRNVTVSFSAWTNSGAQYACGSWGPTPATQTANFSQTQSCSQNQVRNRIYQSGTSTISTVGETRTVGATNSRTVTVAASVWADTTTSNFAGWLPVAGTQSTNFTQTQAYRQNRTRTWTYNVGSTTLSTRVETGYTNESQSRAVTVSYGAWSNSGSQTACGEWGPAVGAQTTNFTQTQTCSQSQVRDRIYQVGGSTIATTADAQTQSVSTINSRTVTVTAGGWSNTTTSNFGSWTPAATTQTAGFTQTRAYRQNRTRTWTYSVGATTIGSRAETGYTDQNQSRAVTVEYGAYSNVGGIYNCGAFGPAPTTQTSNFTQTRSCKQNQARDIVYKVGSATVGTYAGGNARTIDVNDTRTVTVAASAWADTTRTGYSGWSPAPTTQTTTFTQSRTYTQNQSRTWTYRVGSTSLSSRVETQAISGRSESRSVAVSYSAWTNSGAQTACGAWGPASSTQTSNFTQTQTCSQGQVRNRIYQVGTSTIATTGESRTVSATNSRTVTVSVSAWSNTTASNFGSWTPAPTTQTASFTQTRSYRLNRTRTWTYSDGGSRVETGYTNQSQSRTVSVSYSAWRNSGGQFSCGAWTPASSTQTANFTQTQTCSQGQVRDRIYSVGSTVIGTVASANSQTVSVTNTRTISVSVGAWSNTTTSNFGSWTPAPTTQTANFTQTRSYRQNRQRTWTYSDGTSRVETGYTNQSQSQTVTVSASAWATTTTQNYTSWSPAPTTQTANFTQSRSYQQNFARTWTYSVGSTTIYTRPETTSSTRTQNRTVTVSYSAWTNSGSPTSCSGWSPSTNTVPSGQGFTQTRSCIQAQLRTRSYSVGGSATESRNISVTQSQAAIGTDVGVSGQSMGAWTNTGGIYSCSGWSPAASTVNLGQSFTQSRVCRQNQVRTVTTTIRYANGTSSTSSSTENQTVNVTGYQGSVGTKDYVTSTVESFSHYTYSGYFNCGGWSPSPSTVNSGTSFQQSRLCSQYRHLYNDVFDVYKSGVKVKTNDGLYKSRTAIDRTVYQTTVGTKDYVVRQEQSVSHYTYGDPYNCSTWSPSTSTVAAGQTFTQSRSCTVTRSQYNDVYNVYASGLRVKVNDALYVGNTPTTQTYNQTARGTFLIWDNDCASGTELYLCP